MSADCQIEAIVDDSEETRRRDEGGVALAGLSADVSLDEDESSGAEETYLCVMTGGWGVARCNDRDVAARLEWRALSRSLSPLLVEVVKSEEGRRRCYILGRGAGGESWQIPDRRVKGRICGSVGV